MKEKKAKSKSAEALKTSSKTAKHTSVETQEQVGPSITEATKALKSGTIATQGVAPLSATKVVERTKVLKAQPQVLVQGMTPPVIITIARALVSLQEKTCLVT